VAKAASLPALRRASVVLLAGVATGVLVAVLPTLSAQLAVVFGGLGLIGAMVWARLGRVLDAAWIIVIALYVIGPLGSLFKSAGVGLPTVAALTIAPIPFVVGALVIRPEARERIHLLIPLGFLALLAALSLTWSPNPGYGLEKLTLWTLTGLLPAVFIVALASGSPRILWGAIAVGAFFSAIVLIAFGEESPLYPGRIALYGDNPIWTARAAFIGALVAVFGPFPRLARVLMTPVLILAGILTVSLGPLLGFAIGAWAGTVEILRSGRRAVSARPGWVTLGLVSGFALVFLLADAMFGGEGSILSRLVVSDPNVTGRATFLDAALRLFVSSPLLGVGFGGFESTGLIQYPHNLVAEIGSELGLVGLLALAAWVVLALRGAAGSPILVALLVATAVFSLFSGSVASNAEFWLVSALAVSKVPVRARSRARQANVETAAPANPAVAFAKASGGRTR
jgi:O-antigen ligase